MKFEMKDNQFSDLFIDAGENEVEDADPEIQKIKRKSAIQGVKDISRTLNHIEYSGSGLKNETIELEENMRQLIEEGKYGYKYIEDWLLSLGYPLVSIREVFKRLTGVSVEDWMNVDKVLDVPATIPGINYGWGVSKDKEFDYYFIMPYNLGYSIFGQKGDINREECFYFNKLEEAREKLDKITTGANYWDRPVTIDKLKEFPKQNLSEPKHEIHLTASDNEKFINLDNYIYNHYEDLNGEQIENLILQAKLNGDINDKEYNELVKAYIEIKAGPDVEKMTPEGEEDIERIMQEKVEKEEEKEIKKPFEEEIKEVTPSEYFEKNVKEMRKETIPADIVDKILGYIREKNDSLQSFELSVQSFKYTSIEVIKEIEKTIDVDEQTRERFFDANALVSVLLKIKDNTLPEKLNEKLGLLIFSIIGNEIVTPDSIKGEDNNLYGLTEEGLSKYFYKERYQYGKEI